MPRYSRADIHARLAYSELALRIICGIFCVAILIDAVVILSAIDDVEHSFRDIERSYADSHSYKGAAIWSLIVSATGFIYHPIIVVIRLFILSQFCLRLSFTTYAYTKSMLSGIIAACLFSSGVFNAIYAVDNANTLDDYQSECDEAEYYNGFNTSIHGLCSDLKKVRSAEAAAACLSFLAVLVFILLSIVTAYSGMVKLPDPQRQSLSSPTSGATRRHPSLLSSSYTPLYT